MEHASLLLSSWILKQISYPIVNIVFCFFVFEIIPIFLGYSSTIRKNLKDFFLYQFLRGVGAFFFGSLILIILFKLNLNIGFIDITRLSIFSQVVILYFCSEFFIYLAHRSTHERKIPILTKAHKFHHTVREDLQWVNSRKEHLFAISLFVFLFCFNFFILFKSSSVSNLVCAHLFMFFLAFSHFKIPFSFKPLSYVFLFPGDHIRHHTKRGGPYGVSLSLFDTIFNTLDEKNK